MPAASPAPTTVATSDPAPPGIAPDPCEGGEVTPTSGGPAIGGEGGGVLGHGAGTGQGGGNPCGGMRGRGHVPVVLLESATVTGPLDRAIIRRYIKRNLNRIQSCFEHALQSHPGLAGTVTAMFEIGTDGRVASSSATGLADVDTCIAGVIKAIEFPKPAATTTVTFPFVFRPAS
jgi:hypothetical protein